MFTIIQVIKKYSEPLVGILLNMMMITMMTIMTDDNLMMMTMTTTMTCGDDLRVS